eukprot:gnl/MRDRNA2_/MRDRNA2_18774_c0_seq1.p1 gnl/MRDRNA2_/MRDRNA2_18774_c0~~gnl/MRDRNA2_/MRDRNA2_18774_c0_seq1.p1  ORF type:complete len:721 (-),score=121.05 gnl/MRDRNA2_/MRDRNA2_18774_c0_seq1:5-1900(-)
MRLLVHAAMYCGVASRTSNVTGTAAEQSAASLPKHYGALINEDMTKVGDSEAVFIRAHFERDWHLLREMLNANFEDLAAILHSVVHQMSVPTNDNIPVENGVRSWAKLSTLNARETWEKVCVQKFLHGAWQDASQRCEGLYEKWGQKGGAFVADIKENHDIKGFPIEKRRTQMPKLWAFRSEVTLAALHQSISGHENPQAMFPVLSAVLQQPLFSVIGVINCLIGIFEWHAMVVSLFSRRLTKEKAREVTIGQHISSLPPSERNRWERAFGTFKDAWHCAMPHCERYECMTMPEEYRQVKIDENYPLSFAIMDEADEGICPHLLTHWLVERHNELVQIVNVANGIPNDDIPIVSSRLAGPHDLCSYNERLLMLYLRNRCVTYGVGGRLNIDLSQLERHLRRELLRPMVQMESQKFHWLGEATAVSSSLRSTITQKDISPDIGERLKGDLSQPSIANACAQTVQTAIAFIQASGGLGMGNAGEMLLSEYLSSVLRDSAFESLPSQIARAEIRLWHLDAFLSLLKQLTLTDPMEGINKKYKAPLTDDLKEQLKAAMESMPLTVDLLLEAIATMGRDYLKEEYIKAEVPMKQTLQPFIEMDATLEGAVSWVETTFPDDLLMSHWVGVYRELRGN